jgi:hypothetical protein
MDQGDAKAAARDLMGALALYQAAYALVAAPSIQFEIAKTRVALGQLIAGREAALAVNRLPRMPDEPLPFTQARGGAQRLASALEARIPSLVVRVSGTPAGTVATVRVDGEAIPPEAQSVPRKLDPGLHVVVATATGANEVTQQVTLAEGARARLDIALTPLAPAAASAPPALVVPADMRSPSTHPSGVSPLVFAALGVGGAGLVAGTITGALSLAEASSAKVYCTGDSCRPPAQSHINASKGLAWAADIGLGIGVIGVATGTVLYFARPTGAGRAVPAPIAVLPELSFGPKSATASFCWQFH